MNRVTIRQICQDDVESLHPCLDSVARERRYLGFTRAAPIEETRKSLVEDMQRGVIRLIALDESKVVGWCHIRPDRWEGFTHTGWLGMSVLKEYRGQGIGSALLHQTLVEARNRAWKESNSVFLHPTLQPSVSTRNSRSKSKVERRKPENLKEHMTISSLWRFFLI